MISSYWQILTTNMSVITMMNLRINFNHKNQLSSQWWMSSLYWIIITMIKSDWWISLKWPIKTIMINDEGPNRVTNFHHSNIVSSFITEINLDHCYISLPTPTIIDFNHRDIFSFPHWQISFTGKNFHLTDWL